MSSPAVPSSPELVHCLERIATEAGGTRVAVQAISEHLIEQPDQDQKVGSLFIASGCATLALTWSLVLQQRFPDTKAGLLVLLMANFVASIVILIGRQRMRRS
jgi:hypothetical protein